MTTEERAYVEHQRMVRLHRQTIEHALKIWRRCVCESCEDFEEALR